MEINVVEHRRVHYPNEYTMQEGYENYNFAALQLYNDLSDSCGYVGLKIMREINEDERYTEYEYISENEEGSFYLRQRAKHGKQKQDWEDYSRIGLLGLKYSQNKIFLSVKIKNLINQWMESTQINLINKNIDAQGCKQMTQTNWNWKHLTTINFNINFIDAQGCKYLSQSNWQYLTTIYLSYNNIGAQGCKYLSEANWTHLAQISLDGNSISEQGCKYLSQANWEHLTFISLKHNKFGTQGCKYLRQAHWTHLNKFYLEWNKIEKIIYRLLLQQSYPDMAIKFD